MTFPDQPGGQQLPVCENGHPITAIDSACPLCGTGQRQGGATSGFPAAGGFPAASAEPQQGYPVPPAGLPQAPGQGGYQQGGYQQGGYQQGGYQQGGYQQGGYAPDPSGSYQGAAGYSSLVPGGYQGGPGPGYWQQPTFVAPAKTNVLAIVSLVAGILWFFWLGSIVALVCGLLALGQIKARGEGGRGIAIAGIVLASIGMLTLVATIGLFVLGTHTTPAGGS